MDAPSKPPTDAAGGEWTTVATLSADELAALGEGVNLIHPPGRPPLLIHKRGEVIRAALNVCRHQGGRFSRCADADRVVCPRHGWVLDCAAMTYVNPPGVLAQPELRIVPLGADGWGLQAPRRPDPWDREPMSRRPLAPGELTISFLAHACIEVRAGPGRMITDPWPTGPAFMRGWWLQHEPPEDWLERLAAADAIWISHCHSDHLNLPTLRRLAAVNPGVPVLVPRVHPPVWSGRCTELPFPVHELEVDVWHHLSRFSPRLPRDTGLRFMILRDTLFSDLDTALLFEYEGHRILNTVDCCEPNGNHLPRNVDVLLTDFASGASGFPPASRRCSGTACPRWSCRSAEPSRRRASRSCRRRAPARTSRSRAISSRRTRSTATCGR